MNFWDHPLVRRIAISCMIGITVALAISEGSYHLLNDGTRRDPQTIELIIPAGTAERVAAGKSVPSLPANMTFVEGDVLLVKNQDVTDHQLGPIWVPPDSTGSLTLGEVNRFRFGCSFQPGRYLGIDVRSPGSSLQSRLLAIVLIGPPTIALIVVYGILVIPLKPASATDTRSHPLPASAVTLPEPGSAVSDTLPHSLNGKTAL